MEFISFPTPGDWVVLGPYLIGVVLVFELLIAPNVERVNANLGYVWLIIGLALGLIINLWSVLVVIILGIVVGVITFFRQTNLLLMNIFGGWISLAMGSVAGIIFAALAIGLTKIF